MLERTGNIVRVGKQKLQARILQRQYHVNNLTLTHPRYDIFEDAFIGSNKELRNQFFNKLIGDSNALKAMGQFLERAKENGLRVLVKLPENKNKTGVLKNKLEISVADSRNHTDREALDAVMSIFDDGFKGIFKNIKKVLNIDSAAAKYGKLSEKVVINTADRNAINTLHEAIDKLNASRKLNGVMPEMAKAV